MRVQGSGFRVQGSGSRVQGSGFKVQGSGFRVQVLGFKSTRRGAGRVDAVGVRVPVQVQPSGCLTTSNQK